jgi:hypothetical protein
MSKTPFEIRLELLKMAKEMLEQDYFGKREQISSDWNSQVNSALNNNKTPPDHPGFPEYPSELDVIQKAQVLNTFISKS